MRPSTRRTALAIVLTATAIVVPCAAWYVAGSAAARQRAARIRQEPAVEAHRVAGRVAARLGRRLEALRQSESRRPVWEYGGHESLLADGRPPPVRSPLAQGPVDPLIWAHFQIDDLGRLSLPTLAGPLSPMNGSRSDDDVDAIQFAILEELECASSDHVAALRREPASPDRSVDSPTGGVITVGPFTWHTLVIRGQPALVALREVWTPSVVLTQGFVTLPETLDRLLDDSEQPSRLGPGEPAGPGEALVPLDGDAWRVIVDSGAATRAARAEARQVERRFLGNFSIGTLAALLAGCAMILLVRKSERLAHQRAQFAAAAAHELRTPLAGLQLYGEMLAEGLGDPARRTTYARRIADEAGRLARVVSNVLGISHLEHGNLSVRTRVGDLGAAVGESLERLRPAVEAGGARIVARLAPQLPAVAFDPDAVHQVLQNLLDNAEKYTRDAVDRSIEVTLDRQGPVVVLSVIDHGDGVPPILRRRLFRPFSRSEATGAPEGLGIGLALVRALTEAQGATIRYSDAEGHGARFSVLFPLPS